jgi:protein TonB
VPIRIVARLGPRPARSARFLIGSALGHALFALSWILASSLGTRPRPDDAQIFPIVDLVASAPGGGAPPPPPAPPEPEPLAETAEPEGVRAEARPVEPVSKPEEKPPKKEPRKEPKKQPPQAAAKPEPQPTPPVPAPGAGGSGSAGTAGTTSGEDGASVSALQGVGDVELGWYKGQLTAALYRAWRKPILDGIREAREVHVTFLIRRDGSVADLVVVHPSGVPTLDRSALRAVYDAAPLPPLPANWRDSTLPVTLVFQLNPD